MHSLRFSSGGLFCPRLKTDLILEIFSRHSLSGKIQPDTSKLCGGLYVDLGQRLTDYTVVCVRNNIKILL